ncbi:MAG: type II secretion system F family protein [Thermacetogeniaceae bacterium]
MLFAFLILVFLSAYAFFAGLFAAVYEDRLLIAERLAALGRQYKVSARLREELQQPLPSRLGRMVWKKLSLLVSRKMSEEKRLRFQRRLQAAGSPGGWGPAEFRLLQVLLASSGGCVAAAAGWLAGAGLREAMLAGVLGLAFGVLLPDVYLSSRIKARRQEVVRSLPDALDLLMVSVEAGLGFDMALVKVSERFKGALAEEFSRLLHEMKLGKPRREAFKDMAERVGVDDLKAFVGALTQADQLGVSIGNILRVQAAQMRRKRRQRAEEMAMKAPVKMLIPLVFFIFPALFVVLLGPAVIQIMRVM